MTARLPRWSIAAALLLLAAPSFAQDAPKLSVGLFERSVIAALKGCSVRLWQSNRDPDKDRFAVVFYETMDADHNRQPARMEIADKVVQFRRIATGGKTTGYKLYERQVYKSTTDDYMAILDLTLEDEEGEAVGVEKGSITLIQPGKPPFRSIVKGGAGCL